MENDNQNFASNVTEQKKDPIISVQDLNVIYNKGKSNEVRSLEGVTLDIFPEEYVIIFGPSGCGKSTLLYSISGLQKPTSGKVLVDGEDINTYGKKKTAWFHRKKMGMVFQAFYLIGSLNILDNVCLPRTFDGASIEERRQRAQKLLERFSIETQADKFPSELSGGQKQRVSIARSLINDPDVILADEPVGNLDSKSSHTVMSILSDLNMVDKKTVILVTHDPAHLQYGDRIVHMRDGKITKIDTIKKKKVSEVADAESYILKDGKLNKDMITDEQIPAELRHLVRSFHGLTASQISNLLVPFKAQQIFSHLFFSMTNDQIEKAIKKLEDFLYTKIDYEDFFKALDLPTDEGGAGWDKRIAERFAINVRQLTDQANAISFVDKKDTSVNIANFVDIKLSLQLDEARKKTLAQLVFDRLENRIGGEELVQFIDNPIKKEGMGLDRRTALKIAREIELLLLLRYSG